MSQQRASTQLIPALLAGVLTATGCGSSTNFNRIWGGEDQAGDSLLVEGQAAYDKGDFAHAESLTTQLLARNPDNERASILLGFVHLSMASVDPFTIAKKLVDLSPTSTKAAALTGTTSTVTQDAATKAASDAAGILTTMSSLIAISDADKAKLYKHVFGAADNPNVDGTGTNEPVLFKDGKQLVVPATVNADLRSSVAPLNYINMAMKDICRFIDDDVKLADDARDNGSECTQTSATRMAATEAHFLWALTHLSEALVLQPTVLYTPPSQTVPSITAVSDVVNKRTVSTLADLQTFTQEVTEVKNAVGAVFVTGDSSSMLQAILQDLQTVTATFAKIPGLPTKTQDAITNAFKGIQTTAKTLQGGSAVLNNTKAFKSQMTSALSKNISARIAAAASKAGAFTDASEKAQAQAQVQQMCSQYTTLTADAPPGTVSKPSGC